MASSTKADQVTDTQQIPVPALSPLGAGTGLDSLPKLRPDAPEFTAQSGRFTRPKDEKLDRLRQDGSLSVANSESSGSR
jgi:hypothetical protein